MNTANLLRELFLRTTVWSGALWCYPNPNPTIDRIHERTLQVYRESPSANYLIEWQ